MNTLRITVEVDTLSGLKKTSDGEYQIFVTPLKQDGTNLDNLNIPRKTVFGIPDSDIVDSRFILDVDITDGTYSIPDVNFKVEILTDTAIYPGRQYFTIYKQYSIQNTLTEAVENNRAFYMNTTGGGFNNFEVSGIGPEWLPRIEAFRNMTYNGINFQGIDGVRLCIKWGEWEKTDGVFQEATLRAAINYCRDRNLKFSACFWAVHNTSLNIPMSDIATGSNGAYFSVEGFYAIAPYSAVGKARLKAAVKRIAQIMSEYDNTEHISLGYGETEEFYLPLIKDEETHSINQALTGYSVVDRAAWTTYASNHNIAGAQPPVTPDPTNAFTTGDTWQTTTGHQWYNFITDGLALIYAAFNEGVHEGGMKSVGYYADAGGAQSAWYMMYLLPKILVNCEYYYSSDGGRNNDTQNKLLATDLNIGTFPGKKYIIEFDADDLNTTGIITGPLGQQLNPQILKDYGDGFFSRGGNEIAFAQAFSAGAQTDNNYAPNNIAQLAEPIYYLRTKYINTNNFATLPIVTTINFTQTEYKGDAGYRNLWYNAVGNGLSGQAKIVLAAEY